MKIKKHVQARQEDIFFPLFSLNVVKCKNDSNEVNSNNFPCHGIHISYTSHIVEYSMVMEFEVPYLDKKVDDFYPFITSSLKSLLESNNSLLFCNKSLDLVK
jgi:hypothetical protein